MKLRDRTKGVLPNIKQEDCKPSVTNAPSSTVADMNATTVDLTIKQEDSKDHKVLLKQNDEFGSKGYYYHCDICNQRLPNLKSISEHRTSIHGIKQYRKRMFENIDVEPDVHNVDFYCESCERDYSNTHLYRQHLRQAHFMILKPMPNWKVKNGIVPDPHDPSLYCKACNFTYKQKCYYKLHCQIAHGLNPAKFSHHQTSTSSSVLDPYCQACDKRLATIDSYHRHLFLIHKIDSRPIQQKRDDILPNVNDPNFYCRSCEKKLANKDSFTVHLKQVHSIFKSAPKKSKLRPDADDPNNHCRACQKTYISKGRYRTHLRIVHQMTLTPLKGIVNRDLPDPYNPDYYCRVCEKTYALLKLYRTHCKLVHFMKLNHASILNPSAEINVNDPRGYCAQCERSYSSKSSFKQHLARVHSIY